MKKVINSNGLKILAMFFMLIDHLGASNIIQSQAFRVIGRLSFPIFAFLVVEGYFNTSDFKKYLKRLFIFGIVSEVPFDLVFYNTFFYPYYQNIMFTLCLGLLCINELEKIKKCNEIKLQTISTLKIVMYCIVAIISFVDYGIMGILTIAIFYLFRDVKFAWIGQLISLFVTYILFTSKSITVSLCGIVFSFQMQLFALFSLIFVGLYNGKRGKKNKILKYSFYAFYPVHLIVLYLIRVVL